jgi:hypothetical protein
MDYAEKFAIQSKCSRLFLSTTPFLSRAKKLYKSCGFKVTDEGPDNSFGTPFSQWSSGCSHKATKTEEMKTQIKPAESDEEVSHCFPVMVELRPNLEEREFRQRIKRQQSEAGYELVFLEEEKQCGP